MSFDKQVELESQYVLHTYGRKPVEFVRGEGMTLYDDTGKPYLDFLSGIGSVSLGHTHPALTAALTKQAQTLLHAGNYFYIEGRGELAAKLSRLLVAHDPGSASTFKSFFANSGAEANEGAIKIARRHGALNLGGANVVLSAKKSFHGRTLATLAATGQEAKQQAFAPMPAGFAYVELNDVKQLQQALDGGGVCAVLLECIQGEGGVWPCSEEYLAAARALTAERNILLMIDEVQTGFYRTGTWAFAYQHYGIMPDVVTMAKGIANGVPMGAFAARDAFGDLLVPGDHGSTFGGSSLAVAAANATVDALAAEHIGASAQRVGAYFADKLAALPHVTGIRGRGLMLGAALDIPVAGKVVDLALEQGFVINAIGDNTLRFLPPLICTEREVDTLANALTTILAQAETP
jgi:acetylornithine aminotransferase